jgi:hypothetical protein
MSDKNIKFEKSDKPNKKYKATFIEPETKRKKSVYFGDPKYQQYRDDTPLKLYKHLDHNDKERRALYYKRHPKNYPFPSADYFSKYYLWRM